MLEADRCCCCCFHFSLFSKQAELAPEFQSARLIAVTLFELSTTDAVLPISQYSSLQFRCCTYRLRANHHARCRGPQHFIVPAGGTVGAGLIVVVMRMTLMMENSLPSTRAVSQRPISAKAVTSVGYQSMCVCKQQIG